MSIHHTANTKHRREQRLVNRQREIEEKIVQATRLVERAEQHLESTRAAPAATSADAPTNSGNT